jgi:malonate decarboxylase gamma subunit
MEEQKISVKELLTKIFTSSQTDVLQNIIFGKGEINGVFFHILGTIESTFLGVNEAMVMAEKVLDIVKNQDHIPILLLVDVVGQKLEKRDEWLGMYEYFAHLLKCLHLCRKKGNKLISLVYNQAIGGGFIAFGLMADRIYALPHAQVAVMWLDAMSKVTKIDEAILKEISKTSPVFAPGVENFKKLGGLHEVLPLEQVSETLCKVLKEPSLDVDNRAFLGHKLKGRTRAYEIIEKIENL